MSIIKYYDGYVSLEQIRADTCTTLDGTTAFNIIKAASKYGFNASGVQIADDKLAEINVPFIAHVNQNNLEHFVVVYRVLKNQIVIMDPAKGYIKISREQFYAIWTNVAIIMSPNVPIVKLEKNKSIIELFINILSQEKKLVFKVILISTTLSIFTVVSSFYFKFATNNIAHENNLILLIMLMGIVVLFKTILSYLKSYLENYLNKNIDLRVTYPFMHHYSHLPSNTIISRTTGEIVQRFEELNQIKDLFSKVFLTIFLDLILAFVTIIILFNINEQIFFFLCIMLIVLLILGVLFSPFIYKKVVENIECNTEYNSYLIEAINANVSIKNLNITDIIMRKLEIRLVKVYLNLFELNKLINFQRFIKEFVYEFGLFFINSYGFVLIFKGELELIDLITFNSFLVYLINPIQSIVDSIPSINYLKASFNKISEFSDLEEEKLDGNNNFINGDIEFKYVSYSYNDYDYILENVNLKIESCKSYLLRGASGSGKSTVCKLISGLFKSQRGSIFIGSVNLNEYSLKAIRDNITYLSQNEYLFTDTIRENILLGREILADDLQEILGICELETYLKSKPLGLDTYLFENGKNVSGGERQRIILARALVKRSEILILDEAMSEIEEEREMRIVKKIMKKYVDTTFIYISHHNKNLSFKNIIDLESKCEK